ncbi:Tm-1-like ATP-binding domain-containing protein [Plantactinospora sp. GCM10030261]|uniref:Tm-1-like ATP-binding domain-containing protein n=1 Tax=Plantactinospora sp. GCM10030261 TaxID=3273420 RepID=UPI0036221C8B
MATVVLAGALDTKGEEYALAARLLAQNGHTPLLVDIGVRDSPVVSPDISREDVCAAAGSTLDTVRAAPDRAASLTIMADGLGHVLRHLHQDGRLHAVLAMGGSGALMTAAPGFRTLPLGLPKVIVTTMAASDMSSVIGASDLVVLPAVVDIAGINRFSRFAIDRAVAVTTALLGTSMDTHRAGTRVVALTMLGVTTDGVSAARRHLSTAGYETIIFHANGVGGRSLETLAASGWVDAVADLTTAEIASHVVGGTATAGPDRLTAAGIHGIPQLVSIGGCDLAIFGTHDHLPDRYQHRTLYRHGPTATLMRTSVDECRQIGAEIAAKLATARGPVQVILPTAGLSALSVPGGPFHHPAADRALREALLDHLPAHITPAEVDASANDDTFAETAAAMLLAELRTTA